MKNSSRLISGRYQGYPASGADFQAIGIQQNPRRRRRFRWQSNGSVAAAILAAVEGGILPPGRSGPGFRLLPSFSPSLQLREPLSAGQDAPALRQARTPAATLAAALPRCVVSRVMRCLTVFAGLTWLFATTVHTVSAADVPLKAELKGPATEFTVYYQRQKVLVYSFAPQQFKPYVKELYTLKGDNILRDAPHDHLHHHALMYGIRVNGINFWEEIPGSGVQKPIQILRQETAMNSRGQPQVTFSQLIHWVAPQEAFLPDTSGVALLIERRTLVLTLDETNQETALQWQSEFQVGTKTNQVVLTGANYHGLGLRFLSELDPLAIHLNSGNTPDLRDNKQDVAGGRWGSVSFDAPGKPMTVVLFGRQDNARGEARFFTMRTPFAYLSATQGLDQEPLAYRSGDKFQLRYLITLYPEIKAKEFIDRRSQAWDRSE